MRIVALATSAVLLSGCSWLGLGSNSADKSWDDYYRGAQAAGRYSGANRQHHAQAPRPSYGQGYNAPRSYGPCEITSVSQPVPQGCAPEQVTIALPGGQYGGVHSGQGYAGNQYSAPAAGSYGRSLSDINRAQAAANQGIHNNWVRPRFRLTGTAGFERSVSGPKFGAGSASLYNPATHTESFNVGTQADGQITETTYTVENVRNRTPTLEFSDLYSAPFTIGTGAEYQINDRISMFGNASYSKAEGGDLPLTTHIGDINEEVIIQDYVETTPGNFAFNGEASVNNTVRPDVTVANTRGSINDLERTNLEIGTRYYFKDAFPQYLERPLTPYVSASAGAAHYNALELGGSSDRLLLREYWEDSASPQFREGPDQPVVELLEEGWVGTGAVMVGAEWQITPKAALGFETGVRYEAGRTGAGGATTDANIAIPLTLRGSIGF